MQNDDLEMFQKEMKGVRPLEKTDRVHLDVQNPQTPGQLRRRTGAVEDLKKDENYLSDQGVELLDPFEILSFKRDGIQHGVFRKLKLGRYQVDARLDLHRMTLEKARTEVFSFIRESHKYDLRTVMILHGKGDRNKETPGVIKSYTAKWLIDMSEVMAYHSAQKRDGGVGAVYVLLRKSERLKQDNRERYGLK